MKKLFTILLTLTITLCVGNALAWSSAPTTSNTGTLTTTGETVSFKSSGFKTSIDTTKCYKNVGKYHIQATDLYLANNSTKKPAVTLQVNYWSTTHNQWEAGSSKSISIGTTNVKDNNGVYQPAKKRAYADLSASTGKYYYGIMMKDYTSIVMFGKFVLYK